MATATKPAEAPAEQPEGQPEEQPAPWEMLTATIEGLIDRAILQRTRAEPT